MVFIYRFHCTSTTTVCPLGGLYIQVLLYINYYSVSLGWSLYTGSTIHQLRTTMCPLGGLYVQVPLYVNYYNMAHGWSLYTGSTVQQLLQRVSWVVFIDRFHCISPMVHFTTGSISQPNREVGQNQANGPENQALATAQKARRFARGWRLQVKCASLPFFNHTVTYVCTSEYKYVRMYVHIMLTHTYVRTYNRVDMYVHM